MRDLNNGVCHEHYELNKRSSADKSDLCLMNVNVNAVIKNLEEEL